MATAANTIDEVAVHQRRRTDNQIFVALAALYSLILFPILRADRYYNDDMKRSLFGRTGWDSNGRPLTTFLMKLLQCYDHALVDISPLAQIGGALILALTGVLLARRYELKPWWLAALLVFPLGAQPFFLENLSYKFDALSMCLAMLLALVPTLSLRRDRRTWWLGVLALFASLNFYQPAINLCLVFIVTDVVFAQIANRPPREIVRDFSRKVLQIGVAMILYELIVGIHINGWVKRKSQMISSVHDLHLIGANFTRFYAFVRDSFNQQWWIYFGPLLVLAALIAVIMGIRYAVRGQPDKSRFVSVVFFLAALLMPLVLLAAALGPMLLLTDPLIVPRVLLGVGGILCAALLVIHAAMRETKRMAWLPAAFAAMLAIGMIVVASAYGNALGAQKAFEDRIAARLADDIAELKVTRGIHSYMVDGSTGLVPVAAHVKEQFPIIDALVVPYIVGDNLFTTHLWLLFYLPDMPDYRLAKDEDAAQKVAAVLARACALPPITTRSAYEIRVVDDVAIATFAVSNSCHSAAHVPPTARDPNLD